MVNSQFTNLHFTIFNKFSVKICNERKRIYKYDLLGRATKFGEEIVVFCKSIGQGNLKFIMV